MSKNYFKNTIRALEELSRSTTYTMDILPDDDGFIDKECPNEDCLSKFKVNAEDWKILFSDEAVYCPFCGHSATSNNWWTTEQIEQAHVQAAQMISAKIGNALSRDARDFKRLQPRKSFIKLSMKYKGPKHFVNVPAEALDEIEKEVGSTLIWDRGDDKKSSKIYYKMDGVGIGNENEWDVIARFHARWTKKLYDAIVLPYLKEYYVNG